MPTNPSRSSSRPIRRFEIARNTSKSKHLTYVNPFSACAISRIDAHAELCSVCIRDQKEAFSVKPRFPDHFRYLTLDVEDNEEQNLIRLFPSCVLCSLYPCSLTRYRAKAFIDQAIANSGRVLVHCNGLCSEIFWETETDGIHRRNQPFPSLCSNVRHAALCTFMGRRPSYGPKPPILYISQWWFLDTNQGTPNPSALYK